MSAASKCLDALRAQRIVPVIRAGEESLGRDRAESCLAAGLRVVELTTSIPGWDAVLRRLKDENAGLLAGVGTVSSVAQAILAINSGAEFLVAPFAAPAVRAAGARAGVPVIEAGMTPTEIRAAAQHGKLVKVFPAHVVGPSFVRSLRAVLPEVELMPTGGIALEDAGAWLEAGAFAVGVGADLTDSADIAGRIRSLGI